MAEIHNPPVFSPKTLYQLSVLAATNKFLRLRNCLYDLPNDVLFDIYYQLYKEKRLYLLGIDLRNPKIFSRMLTVTNRRVHLLQCFQGLIEDGVRIEIDLSCSYIACCLDNENTAAQDKLIELGLKLGRFLSDAGWYAKSEEILLACKNLCLANNSTPDQWYRTLECYRRLLHVQTTYCLFLQATETQQLALELLERLKETGQGDYNFAAIYTEFSNFFCKKNEYDKAYRWSIEALKQLKSSLSARITVDVLRHAAKSCALKREFQRGGLLIRQAVYLAKAVFGIDHPVYSNVLVDYAFYWLNFDNIINSINLYKDALAIRTEIFGDMNLHVALAHEDLAYALYVYEYSSGIFPEARQNTYICLLCNWLKMHSAKEIYKQQSNTETWGACIRAWGNEAESMHLKAIRIKEELLGSDDYEVGLSVGHLASLYNYHMNRYRDAEKLYYRSIKIYLKWFGESYSGLEYDYHGLLNVYTKLNESDKVHEYEVIFNKWRLLRSKHLQSEEPTIDPKRLPQPIKEVIERFFSM
ncbi:amyloid protein-binding protein 2 isoform X2 [Ceratina calcarata]|uniref:Amyloid protein-binding protein 2 isoform X2 n=1 Tax=Ceratina calcarata TaxID=156304 RepID=A0AAJ7IWR7_9HYME|nr:amyloid protein-binding protein 2 isoform X2 [Ceratina calcarata]